MQPRALGGDPLEHPRVHLDDQPGLLGDVDEFGRQHQPVAVLDAHQRLRGADLPVARSTIGWKTGASRFSASALRSSVSEVIRRSARARSSSSNSAYWSRPESLAR